MLFAHSHCFALPTTRWTDEPMKPEPTPSISLLSPFNQCPHLCSLTRRLLLSLLFALPVSAADLTHTFGVADGPGNTPDGVLVYIGNTADSFTQEIDMGSVPLGERDARWIEITLDDQVDHYITVATYIDSSIGRLTSEFSSPHLFSAVVSTPDAGTSAYFEDFESYAIGSDPSGWLATAASNSLLEDSSVFGITQLSDGNMVYGTTSERTNIHSHHVIDGSAGWQNYEFGGSFAVSELNSGTGITLYSDYPNSDSYYRLRSYRGRSFSLSSHGSSSLQCEGRTDTGVALQDSRWYHFRFRASNEASGTHLQAKVWSHGSAEPGDWQVDCTDPQATLRAGQVGLWAMGSGEKVWDDLYVVSTEASPPETPSPEPLPLPLPDRDGDGMSDADDNCVEVYNPDQADTDSDGQGNACELDEQTLYSEDFTGYIDGQEPTGWYDSDAGNSLLEADRNFMVMELEDGNLVLGTESTDRNIHSHYIINNSATWIDYEFSGQFVQTNTAGGVGVTVYSDFPNSNAYYRLRTYRGKNFELSAHGNGSSNCSRILRNTGVSPASDVWFNFRLQAFGEGLGTRVQAKVWSDGSTEPMEWQTSCMYSTAPRAGGSPGVWSMGLGSKFWDNLIIKTIK